MKLGSGWAYAVSADGATILADTGDGSTGSAHPVAWRDGSFIELGLNGAFARLLSADGSVVAARVETSFGVTQAVLRSVVGGAVTMLGDFPTGPEWSEPNAINADGTVVAGYGNTTGGQEPFVWTAASGQMVNLGAVGDVVNQTVARATNADGSAVVGTSLTDGGTAILRLDAGRWDEGLCLPLRQRLEWGAVRCSFPVVAPAAHQQRRRRRRRHAGQPHQPGPAARLSVDVCGWCRRAHAGDGGEHRACHQPGRAAACSAPGCSRAARLLCCRPPRRPTCPSSGTRCAARGISPRCWRPPGRTSAA